MADDRVVSANWTSPREKIQWATALKRSAYSSSTKNRIALLVTDGVMPGMHGDELAILLTGLHPELPVLLVSAYYQQIQPSVQHFQCFVKPFHPCPPENSLWREVKAWLKLGNIVTSADTLPLLRCRVHREEWLHKGAEYFRTTPGWKSGRECRAV